MRAESVQTEWTPVEPRLPAPHTGENGETRPNVYALFGLDGASRFDTFDDGFSGALRK